MLNSQTNRKEKEKSIFHLEIQTDDDGNMHNRMFTYAALLNETYNKIEKDIVKPFMPIRQAVIYLGHLERDKYLQSKMLFELDFGYYTYQYKIMNISSIPYDEFLKDKETLVFAILGNFQSLDAVLVVDIIVESVLKYVDNIIERNELLIDILMLANLRKLSEVVEKIIKNNPKIMANNIDFTKFPLYLEGKLDGKEEIATTMLQDKMPIEQIMKFTGLTFEQITALQEKMSS